MKSDITANDIRACFREYYQYRFNEVGLFEFRISYENYRDCQFDAIMISPHRRIIKGFEFKVSRSDFLTDLKIRPKIRSLWTGIEYDDGSPKWKGYLKYCNLFFWVCPEELIKPEEIESPAGLIWIVGEPPLFHLRVKKRPQKINKDMPIELQQRILFLFAARTKTRNASYF